MFPDVETDYVETIEEVDGKVIEVKRVRAKDLESDTWITIQKTVYETGKTATQLQEAIQTKADEEKAKYEETKK